MIIDLLASTSRAIGTSWIIFWSSWMCLLGRVRRGKPGANFSTSPRSTTTITRMLQTTSHQHPSRALLVDPSVTMFYYSNTSWPIMFQHCDVPKLAVVSPIFNCSNLLMFKCKSTQWCSTATPGSGQPITGPSCSQQRRKVIAITSQDLHPACALIWASMTSRCGTNCQQEPMPHLCWAGQTSKSQSYHCTMCSS